MNHELGRGVYNYIAIVLALSKSIFPQNKRFNKTKTFKFKMIFSSLNTKGERSDTAFSQLKKFADANRILHRIKICIQLPSRVRVSGHSMWVSWWTKRSLGRFFSGFLPYSPTTNFIPPFLHTHLIHFVSFHFISICDGATGVVGLHPCYSLTNIGASTHLISRSGHVTDNSRGCFIFYLATDVLSFTIPVTS